MTVDGIHLVNFTNDRVESVRLTKTSYLLQGLSSFFLNIIRYVADDAEVKQISREDLREYKKLKILQLGDNELKDIPGDAFYDLNELESLDLTGNQLIALPANLLFYLPNLKSLALGFNRLQSFSSTIIERNLQINQIYLVLNDIRMISPDLITRFNDFKDDYADDCNVSLDDPKFTESINKQCNKNCGYVIESAMKFKNLTMTCKSNLFAATQENQFLKSKENTCALK